MADKIEEEERQSIAHAEVSAELGGDTLESDFLRLEAGTGGVGVEDQLLALKAEMGLIEAPAAQAPKQLEAGDDDEAADGPVQEAQVEEASSDDDGIPEAQLLSEFDKLEEKQQAES